LPNRRAHEPHSQRPAIHAGIGRFDDGRLVELFSNTTGRFADELEVLARDAAICASIALQFDADTEVIRKALCHDGHGAALGRSVSRSTQLAATAAASSQLG
jgi:glycosyltransferase A (GT-A) superfamily protein (DUF2064 family)